MAWLTAASGEAADRMVDVAAMGRAVIEDDLNASSVFADCRVDARRDLVAKRDDLAIEYPLIGVLLFTAGTVDKCRRPGGGNANGR